ncbi:MAG TPA: hypothetical protein VKA60_22895 [Blastocatellia bacterium]|nr:hypothetical protein [Blastocatellia bacterium]
MKRLFFGGLIAALALIFLSCHNQSVAVENAYSNAESSDNSSKPVNHPPIQNPGRVIHVVVALCDNRYQGIVPVPARIGNGDDPANNLYWGAAYGVRTFFQRSNEWRLIKEVFNPKPAVLERVVFKHKRKDAYLVADAYRGRDIRQTTIDLLRFAAGSQDEIIDVRFDSKSLVLNAGAGAELVAYIGHDGLMDFTLAEYPRKTDQRQRDVIILACASKAYFGAAIQRTGANPMLWTTGLMAPEAYVLSSAIDGWLVDESGERIRQRAAEAYNRYQKCGMKAALKLFSNGR